MNELMVNSIMSFGFSVVLMAAIRSFKKLKSWLMLMALAEVWC